MKRFEAQYKGHVITVRAMDLETAMKESKYRLVNDLYLTSFDEKHYTITEVK